jgi:hypothetical protein
LSSWKCLCLRDEHHLTTTTKTLALIFALEFSLILSSGGTSAGGRCLCQNGNWMHSGVQTADHTQCIVLFSLAQTIFIKHLNFKVLIRSGPGKGCAENIHQRKKYFKIFLSILRKRKSSVLNFNFEEFNQGLNWAYAVSYLGTC